MTPLLLVSVALACTGANAREVVDPEPLALATRFVRQHYSPETFNPNGVGLEHVVWDCGAIWEVEFWPADSVTGGGLRLRIRKSDKKVLSAVRSQ